MNIELVCFIFFAILVVAITTISDDDSFYNTQEINNSFEDNISTDKVEMIDAVNGSIGIVPSTNANLGASE